MKQRILYPGELLLPAPQVDPSAWACVACDQFTSQPEYWAEARRYAEGKPSALRLILPECDLEQAGQRVPEIHDAMREVCQSGVVTPGVENGMILTARRTVSGARVGLVALLDLECYDYRKGFRGPVRATEETIESRLPARMNIRRGAALELSHVLMLVDDPGHTVLEPLYRERGRLKKLYDFSLMMNGGQLTGYAVTEPADLDRLQGALDALGGPFPFAVGDGNHSLASAKACWEEIRPSLTEAEAATHPARFAMVEVENLHDPALCFEPIHRVVFGCEPEQVLADWSAYAAARGMTLAGEGEGQPVEACFGGISRSLRVRGSEHALPVGTLQRFLDDWLADHPEARLDYVHGDDSARRLASPPNTLAFLLPAPDLTALFPVVDQLGALPRKTFSMGAAHEKRYYMEARRLF